ncbi:MAG: 16S rRNA processing protein RimM [Candidatus Dadabacteria bacterium]|nr:MAG: 16S rRNA processing protein RimM [Candidatus Dadabacteria bacterium]
MGRARHVAVGRVGRPHGVRGEVRVDPQGSLPRGLEGYTRFYLDRGRGPEPVGVEHHRIHGRFVLVKFEGYDTPEAARELTHAVLYVDRSELPPLGEGEYYHADLLGCEVVEENGDVLGRVADVFDSGAHDVLVIRTETGAERMLPVVAQWVLSIDVEAGRITVRVPEGMWD